MQSTTQTNFDRETIIPSIKPEVIEFFRNEVNPDMTPEQIKDVVDSLNLEPNLQPNPIQGQIVNLLYLQEGNNLAALVIQDDDTSQLYTLSAESDLVAEANTIRIDNLKDFQLRLQDTFNHNSLVSIYYENNRIESLVIIKQKQNSLEIPEAAFARSGSQGSKCHLPPRRC